MDLNSWAGNHQNIAQFLAGVLTGRDTSPVLLMEGCRVAYVNIVAVSGRIMGQERYCCKFQAKMAVMTPQLYSDEKTSSMCLSLAILLDQAEKHGVMDWAHLFYTWEPIRRLLPPYSSTCQKTGSSFAGWVSVTPNRPPYLSLPTTLLPGG